MEFQYMSYSLCYNQIYICLSYHKFLHHWHRHSHSPRHICNLCQYIAHCCTWTHHRHILKNDVNRYHQEYYVVLSFRFGYTIIFEWYFVNCLPRSSLPSSQSVAPSFTQRCCMHSPLSHVYWLLVQAIVI